MKKLLFSEAKLATANLDSIVPTNAALWANTNSLFELQDHSYLVAYYESLGGRWKVTSRKVNEVFGQRAKAAQAAAHAQSAKVIPQPAVVADPVDEEVERGAFGIPNDEETLRWFKNLKKCRPGLYEKIKNWD